MAGKQRYKREEIVAAIHDSRGFKTVAARRLGLSFQGSQNYCLRYPSLDEEFKAARAALVDLAEAQLHKLISEGNVAATIFALKTIGKSRGYIERVEQITEHVLPITQIKVTYPKEFTPPTIDAEAEVIDE